MQDSTLAAATSYLSIYLVGWLWSKACSLSSWELAVGMPAVAAAAVWGCHVEEKLLGASAGAIARPDWEDAIGGRREAIAS